MPRSGCLSGLCSVVGCPGSGQRARSLSGSQSFGSSLSLLLITSGVFSLDQGLHALGFVWTHLLHATLERRYQLLRHFDLLLVFKLDHLHLGRSWQARQSLLLCGALSCLHNYCVTTVRHHQLFIVREFIEIGHR